MAASSTSAPASERSRDDLDACDWSPDSEICKLDRVDQRVIHGTIDLRFVDAEAAGRVALGVEVDDEDPLASESEVRGEIHHCRGLPHATFLVGAGDDLPHSLARSERVHTWKSTSSGPIPDRPEGRDRRLEAPRLDPDGMARDCRRRVATVGSWDAATLDENHQSGARGLLPTYPALHGPSWQRAKAGDGPRRLGGCRLRRPTSPPAPCTSECRDQAGASTPLPATRNIARGQAGCRDRAEHRRSAVELGVSRETLLVNGLDPMPLAA